MPTRVLPTPAIFDFDQTAAHQTLYRGVAGADVYEGGVYYRALRSGQRVLVPAVREAEAGGALEVSLPDDASETDLDYAAEAIARMLGFDADLEGFYAASAADPVMAAATSAMWGLRPARTETVFEALVMAVIGQQISGAVARVIRELLVHTFGTPVEAHGQALYAFPTPQALAGATHEELRAVKLSNRKAEYIHDIAAKTLDGTIDDAHLAAMDDEAVVEELVKARGIGRWTAEWMLIRALGRPDVAPAGDLALKRAVSQFYLGGSDPKEAELAHFMRERWTPYRGLATTYLFANLRLQRVTGEAAF